MKSDHPNDVTTCIVYNLMKLRFFFKYKKKIDKNPKINSFTIVIIVPQL